MVIGHRDSPETFAFDHELPDDWSFALDPSGSVLVVDSADHIAAEIAKPWALDASGAEIFTSYRVEGETLFLDVNHREGGTVYPVVADPDYTIIAQWDDPAGNRIRLRQHFHFKIVWEHNVTLSTVGKIVERNHRVFEGGTTYRYWDTATKYSCGWWGCTIEDQMDIKILYDARRISDGLALGIFNGYCIHPTWRTCPDWVNQSIN